MTRIEQEETEMMREEYEMYLRQVWMFAQLVQDWPLEKMVRMQERGVAFGPFADPTMWRNNIGRLMQDKAVTEAIFTFQRKVDSLIRGFESERDRKASLIAAAATDPLRRPLESFGLDPNEECDEEDVRRTLEHLRTQSGR